ncbi:AGAP003147-PA-like protein [Anopheles sinensis]|uniref:AGAP003147-PA-like protein n=1 Tax=Anopheles sinensis TaxID=74873 RepID=A0A084VRG3_ANOSI|nr:AGAP003147-PA-like protein [Anopheles sinensis]
MSWFQDLAGRAENILTKIDQNAATVLQTRPESDEVDTPLLEVSVASETTAQKPAKPRVVSTGSILSVKNPKGMTRSASNSSYERNIDENTETLSSKSEKQNFSDTSSRRSSLNSKKDGTVIDMSGVVPNNASVPALDPGYSVEKELAAMKIILAEVKSERDELKSELDNAMSLLSNGETEAKLLELEALCQSLADEKNDLATKLLGIEEANSKYVKSISELESTVAKHIQSEQELSAKLETTKLEAENTLSELQQYRVRAHATLQLKEKTIEQLKEQITAISSGGNSDPDVPTVSNSEQILQIELEQTRQEKANLLDELNALNERTKQRETQWIGVEEKLKLTLQGLEQKVLQLEQQVSSETDRILQLQDDFKIKQKELLSAREEMVKQRTSFTFRLHEKESEITKLRHKLHTRPGSPSTDLEDRLTSLTQSLVQKQTALESITAEKNALRIQLEKLENQYRSTASQVRQQRAVYLNSNVTDDAKSQVPNFMVENPFDNNVARRMKRAYSSLDSIGIRLGVFLRRNPVIRILVIVYVAVLHLWVMFVLLSSTPT